MGFDALCALLGRWTWAGPRPSVDADLSSARVTTTADQDFAAWCLLDANGWKPRRLALGVFRVPLVERF